METYYKRTAKEWNATKNEMKAILIARAKQRKTISYSELAALITTSPVDPEEAALAKILGEISAEEDALGRGMLSVVVVKKGESISGRGFFTFAKELGRDTTDNVKTWVDEFNKVCDSWAT